MSEIDPSVSEPQTPTKFWKTYKVPILFGSASLLLIVISITILIKSTQTVAPIQFSSDQEASSAGKQLKTLTVDIEGAVAKPGVYHIPDGARIDDAIFSAGGLSADADMAAIAKTINRAAKILDGGKLYFPKKGDSQASTVGSSSNQLSSSSISSVGTLVSVNSASQKDLEALPGIGPVTAGKIISNRPYQVLEELVSKKAMSQSLFEKLKDQITL
jgi:competence protein ComEA